MGVRRLRRRASRTPPNFYNCMNTVLHSPYHYLTLDPRQPITRRLVVPIVIMTQCHKMLLPKKSIQRTTLGTTERKPVQRGNMLLRSCEDVTPTINLHNAHINKKQRQRQTHKVTHHKQACKSVTKRKQTNTAKEMRPKPKAN